MTLGFCKDKNQKGLPGVLFSSFRLGDAATFHGLRGHFSEQHHNHTQHLTRYIFNLQFVAIN